MEIEKGSPCPFSSGPLAGFEPATFCGVAPLAGKSTGVAVVSQPVLPSTLLDRHGVVKCLHHRELFGRKLNCQRASRSREPVFCQLALAGFEPLPPPSYGGVLPGYTKSRGWFSVLAQDDGTVFLMPRRRHLYGAVPKHCNAVEHEGVAPSLLVCRTSGLLLSECPNLNTRYLRNMLVAVVHVASQPWDVAAVP